MTTAHGQRAALVALFVGALGIATAPILVRYSEVGPVATGFWRLLLSLPLLLILQRIWPQPAGPGGQGRYLALSGVFFALDLFLYHIAITLTSVANSTLLSNTAPIFVAIGAWILWRQRLTALFMVGLVLSFLGALLLSLENLQAGGGRLIGDAFGLASGLFYGCYILTMSRVRANHSTLVVMTWTGMAGAAVLLLISLALGERVIPTALAGWWPLLALGLFTQVGGQGLIAYALAHLPAHFSAVALLVQPAGAAVLAWLLFNEPLGLWQAVGAVVILSGIIIARRGSRAG